MCAEPDSKVKSFLSCQNFENNFLIKFSHFIFKGYVFKPHYLSYNYLFSNEIYNRKSKCLKHF